jgi:two-component system, NarL family, nitrate/nitrite response regulator NarL
VITILCVSVAPLVRAGVRAMLAGHPELSIVAEAASVPKALKLAASDKPDIILFDVVDNVETAIDAVQEFLRVAPARILILSSGGEGHIRAMEHGASGVIWYWEPAELIAKAIQRVHLGELWLDRSTTATIMMRMVRGRTDVDPEGTKIETLTRREREIVHQIGEGLSNKQIAERLFISEATVRNHLSSVLEKLELSNRFGLAVYAFRHGLVRPPSRTRFDSGGTSNRSSNEARATDAVGIQAPRGIQAPPSPAKRETGDAQLDPQPQATQRLLNDRVKLSSIVDRRGS